MRRKSRREFVRSWITAGCALSFSGGLSRSSVLLAAGKFAASPLSPTPLPIKKGVLLDMLPDKLSYADRFNLARDVGFDVVQAPTTPDERTSEEIKKAADAASIPIDRKSVV